MIDEKNIAEMEARLNKQNYCWNGSGIDENIDEMKTRLMKNTAEI